MADQVSDLQAAIMNLPNQADCYSDFGDDWHAGFAEGHRDARHAAAELAASHAADVEAMRDLLKRAENAMTYSAATVAVGNRGRSVEGWVEVHGGRADSAYRQLSQCVEEIRAALKGDKP